MNVLLKFVGSAVVASTLAVVLTLFVFGMPRQSAVQTGLIAAGVALALVFMNTRDRDDTTEPQQRGN